MSSKKAKKGFTLIEVILFLAVSGLILIGILAGTGTSLMQQRYNDSVQDLYSFLQSQYAGVIDVRNVNGHGNSPSRAIYGKLISFEGETVNSWTITGNALDEKPAITNINTLFENLDLRVVCNENNTHTMQWGSRIQKTGARTDIKKSVAILRSPTNGTIYTYKSKNEVAISNCDNENFINKLGGTSFLNVFDQGDVDICIQSADKVYGDKRRDIRISNTNSINSVKLVPLDGGAAGAGDNKCL